MASSIQTQDEMRIKDMMPNWKDVVMVVLLTLFVCAVLFLAGVVSGCSSNVGQTSYKGYETYALTPKEKIQWQEEIIKHYNNLLYQIWIDNPTYVEECLSEGDEFVELDNLMGQRFRDIFEFNSIEDSIQYSLNWDSSYTTKVVKHIIEDKDEESW